MHHTRRRFLSGASALPPLLASLPSILQGRSDTKSPPRKRFVFCMKANGLWAEMIQPKSLLSKLPFKAQYDGKGRLVEGKGRKGTTPPADEAIQDFEPHEALEPLRPFLDRVTVIQGVNSGFGVYHMGNYQTLGAFQGRRRDSRDALGQTIDSVLAQALPAPVPHVCLGHDPKSPSGVAYVPASAAGPGKPLPFYTKPVRAYKELFGIVDSGAAGQAYQVQSGILDFFVDDARRLRKMVAGPEVEPLERYLHAFESVRTSRQDVESIGDSLRKHAPEPPRELEPHAIPEILAGHTDLAVASLLSGLTTVVTIKLDQLGSTSYPGIGGLHGGVGHGQVKNIIKARSDICRIHFEQIARMAKALNSVPEGDGTMLDNTVFIYTSDNGETHHSSGVNYPVLLLGDLGGRLASGRYFCPGNEHTDRSKPDYTRLGDLWATLLAAAGQSYEGFGAPLNGIPHAPIEALLA